MTQKLNAFVQKIDQKKLWILGFFFTALCFLPYIILGEGSVYLWHDQLDENILQYIIPARHILEGLKIYPEMMCGVNVSALDPFAIFFLPLYCVFSNYVAFTIQYCIIFLMAFFGMYALVKHFSDSSILSFFFAICFSLLPFYPVYGASVAAIPLAIYVIINISDGKMLLLCSILLVLLGTTINLVFTGYTILFFWFIWIFIKIVNKKPVLKDILCFCELCALFVLSNIHLFMEYLPGAETFVAHRSEFIYESAPFWQTFWSSFFTDAAHARPLHKYMVLPALLGLGISLFFRSKLDTARRKRLKWALADFVTILMISLFCAFFKSEFITSLRNSSDGLFSYFQFDRFSWLFPALWYILFGLIVSVWWDYFKKASFAQIILLVMVMLPTLYLIASKSNIYMNTYELFKGHQYTGYIPWEDYYAEDVMQEIEDAIGEDITSYRVVHLGLNPTPALVHGFYTVDGYSGYYPLEYKHRFRKVVEKEFEKAPDVANYFDTWGSRCYLFNSQSGIAHISSKYYGITYEGLEIDWTLLKNDFNCQYVFACGPILDFEKQGLEEVGYFTSDHCFWGFNVYRIK